MKTTGLDFISAVKAVKDGLCEKAYSKSTCREITKESDDGIRQELRRFNTFLATDYELINPRVPIEDVEVKRWLCTTCGSVFVCPSALACACNRSEFPLVQLTGTYQRPVKEKVTKRGVYGGAIYANGVLKVNDPCEEIPIGKPLVLQILWEEEA